MRGPILLWVSQNWISFVLMEWNIYHQPIRMATVTRHLNDFEFNKVPGNCNMVSDVGLHFKITLTENRIDIILLFK